MTQGSHEITRLLLAWSEGDREALDRLAPLVYAELRRLAKSYMRKERAGHTLQTTALINEAYLRLIDVTPKKCARNAADPGGYGARTRLSKTRRRRAAGLAGRGDDDRRRTG